MDLNIAKSRLEALLSDLDSTSATLEGESPGVTDELSTYDQHPADLGTDVADQQRGVAQLELLGDQRAQVLAALARVEAGTYGRCVVCGRELPDERLEARPEAALCIDDQRKAEPRT